LARLALDLLLQIAGLMARYWLCHQNGRSVSKVPARHSSGEQAMVRSLKPVQTAGALRDDPGIDIVVSHIVDWDVVFAVSQ
jgi:hypothetical protein